MRPAGVLAAAAFSRSGSDQKSLENAVRTNDGAIAFALMFDAPHSTAMLRTIPFKAAFAAPYAPSIVFARCDAMLDIIRQELSRERQIVAYSRDQEAIQYVLFSFMQGPNRHGTNGNAEKNIYFAEGPLGFRTEPADIPFIRDIASYARNIKAFF